MKYKKALLGDLATKIIAEEKRKIYFSNKYWNIFYSTTCWNNKCWGNMWWQTRRSY